MRGELFCHAGDLVGQHIGDLSVFFEGVLKDAVFHEKVSAAHFDPVYRSFEFDRSLCAFGVYRRLAGSLVYDDVVLRCAKPRFFSCESILFCRGRERKPRRLGAQEHPVVLAAFVVDNEEARIGVGPKPAFAGGFLIRISKVLFVESIVVHHPANHAQHDRRER